MERVAQKSFVATKASICSSRAGTAVGDVAGEIQRDGDAVSLSDAQPSRSGQGR
jgi:hypothetical protein